MDAINNHNIHMRTDTRMKNARTRQTQLFSNREDVTDIREMRGRMWIGFL